MPDTPAEQSVITRNLQRLAEGDRDALDDLITSASVRLQRLTTQMLNRFAGVRRWEQTDDVLQNAMVRLVRALHDVQPQNGAEFLSLAALQIRRELIDLARHYFGPEGHGAHHASWPGVDPNSPTVVQSRNAEPSQLAEWREVHERVEELPLEEQQVVLLLLYDGLTQDEAAQLLEVSVRTVQRRWQSALLSLHRKLKDETPADV